MNCFLLAVNILHNKLGIILNPANLTRNKWVRYWVGGRMDGWMGDFTFSESAKPEASVKWLSCGETISKCEGWLLLAYSTRHSPAKHCNISQRWKCYFYLPDWLPTAPRDRQASRNMALLIISDHFILLAYCTYHSHDYIWDWLLLMEWAL